MSFNLFNRKNKNDNSVSVEAVVDNTDFSKNNNDFRLVFNDSSENNTNCEIITFGDLTRPQLSDTLTIYQNEKPLTKLDIKYSYLTWDKKQAAKFHRFIAIGLSGFFYLYDLSSKRFTLFLDFNGYFYDLQTTEEYLLVAYHSGIYCLTKYGQIKWHNSQVGLDGITIDKISGGKIYGSEQIDPPDGWRDFVLNIDSGSNLQ